MQKRFDALKAAQGGTESIKVLELERLSQGFDSY
jgi:hypothetical protein